MLRGSVKTFICEAKQLAGTVPETESVQMVFDSLPANVKATLSLTQQGCEELLLDVLGELSETLEMIICRGDFFNVFS